MDGHVINALYLCLELNVILTQIDTHNSLINEFEWYDFVISRQWRNMKVRAPPKYRQLDCSFKSLAWLTSKNAPKLRHITGHWSWKIRQWRWIPHFTSRVSYTKGRIRHAYAWQIGPFWQDTLDMQKTFPCHDTAIWLHDDRWWWIGSEHIIASWYGTLKIENSWHIKAPSHDVAWSRHNGMT